MLPWNYGFHWSAGSVIFLGAFYTVLVIVLTTVVSAVWRARRTVAAQGAGAIRWRSEFHDLPQSDRACRHALTGEMPGRVCPNAFDCRRCETHAALVAARPAASAAPVEEEVFGMTVPLDRLYHRGHTWVRPETDGTVTVGLDELGRRLLGTPDAVELPAPGERVQVSGPAWRIWKRGAGVRVLCPVDGEVVEAGGPYCGWYLRVKPTTSGFDFRHLLAPAEVKPWFLREMERLQLALSMEGAPTLADGGALVMDIAGGYPQADWDAVCSAMFLQA